MITDFLAPEIHNARILDLKCREDFISDNYLLKYKNRSQEQADKYAKRIIKTKIRLLEKQYRARVIELNSHINVEVINI